MRLKQIKLSGFKSFVDPTAFNVPSQLVGVVGPNGCGKSNVIDAVRWVLGESKASELRGESMQDVIFSGSADRKPSARASVELVFDNSLGRIGGNWAQYGEISVRRILSRDNQSTYQINNQNVRRRDVHDMFLGTGLGPRAYAIIGQGTISRIIEAKPDELRVFLEEAAGVSKYKERRKETESRLASTRENLIRVEDIDRELSSQINRLNRQAEVAAQFRELDQDRQHKQQMHWLVRRIDAAAAQTKAAAAATAAAAELEEKITELRKVESLAESIRQQYEDAGNAVHTAQGLYYETNTQVSKLEAEIARLAEINEQLTAQISRYEAELTQLAERDGQTRREQAEAAQGLTAAHEQVVLLEQTAQARRSELASATESLRQAALGLESAREQADVNRRELERADTGKKVAAEQLANLSRRSDRARAQERAIQAFDAGSVAQAVAAVALAVASESQAQHEMAERQQRWSANEAQRGSAQQALRDAETRFAQIDARIDALRELQNRLDRQNDMHDWLAERQMGGLQPVWQRIRIDDDWEAAVENVLREKVSAIQLENLQAAVDLADQQPPAKLVVFSAADTVPAGGVSTKSELGLKPLASVVRSGDPVVQDCVAQWLHGVYVAETLADAMLRRADLPAGAEFVVRAGHRVAANAIQLFAADNEREGVLKRQHELENLARDHRAQELLVEQARKHANQIEMAAAAHKNELESTQSNLAQLSRQLAAAQIAAQRFEQEADQVRIDRERVAAELLECESEQARLIQVIEAFDATVSEQASVSELLGSRTDAARTAVADAEQQVNDLRDSLREAETQHQHAQFDTRSLEEALNRFSQLSGEIERRTEQLQQDLTISQEKLASLDSKTPSEQLQTVLATRSEREQALNQARQHQEELAANLRSADENRLTLERAREPLMQRGTELQLKEQAARLSVEQFQEQLDEAGVDAAGEERLQAVFEDSPKASWLQTEVTRLNNAIATLGPVNLAALDELSEATERKGFLDSQSADLNEAIATLEDAIRKIDLETRALLQQTFNSVNEQFGKLFPELFGGGDARLELTGEEILDAGVQVMAHPPGKRNSSIHLLSGGEKALTAIALVFALFHLNPAPFCLLDEVDAPLDDANTERYRDMVTRMSDQTQFLFITHNKIAMEMAQQLIGVTMGERGVSRIVAVDLDQAAEFAEAA